jgi:hypothetical protein
MGMFSWYTQDTNKRIVANQEKTIIMTDMFGNKWVEECYEGYGEFGGKDFYELLAEMNGLGSDREKGIELAFEYASGYNPFAIFPSLTENGEYMKGVAPTMDDNQGFNVGKRYAKKPDPKDYHRDNIAVDYYCNKLKVGDKVALLRNYAGIDYVNYEKGVTYEIVEINFYNGNCLIKLKREDSGIILGIFAEDIVAL